MSGLLKPKTPGLYVNPTPSGAEIEIIDGQGRYMRGKLNNEALLEFGRRCIEVANRQHPNRIIMPTEN